AYVLSRLLRQGVPPWSGVVDANTGDAVPLDEVAVLRCRGGEPLREGEEVGFQMRGRVHLQRLDERRRILDLARQPELVVYGGGPDAPALGDDRAIAKRQGRFGDPLPLRSDF